jgi:hypothetical protein
MQELGFLGWEPARMHFISLRVLGDGELSYAHG